MMLIAWACFNKTLITLVTEILSEYGAIWLKLNLVLTLSSLFFCPAAGGKLQQWKGGGFQGIQTLRPDMVSVQTEFLS